MMQKRGLFCICFVLMCSVTLSVTAKDSDTEIKYKKLKLQGEIIYNPSIEPADVLKISVDITKGGSLSLCIAGQRITAPQKAEAIESKWGWETVIATGNDTILILQVEKKPYCQEGTCEVSSLIEDLTEGLNKLSFLEVKSLELRN